MYSTWPVHLSASVHQCSSLLHSDLTVLQQLVQVGFVILWAVVRGAIQWVSYLHLLDLFHLGGKGCWWRKKILVFLNKADFAFSSQTLAIELHYGKCKSECFRSFIHIRDWRAGFLGLCCSNSDAVSFKSVSTVQNYSFHLNVSVFRRTHHPADVLIMDGFLHKQTSSGNAVLTFVEIHGAHALWSRRHTTQMQS